MRIQTFRAWFSQAVENGVGAAKRAGMAISRRIRPRGGSVDPGVGVGDDESSFGGGRGSRAWLEIVDEYIERLKRWIFEKSSFEKHPRFEAFIRRLLGLETTKRAPPLPKPRPRTEPVRPASQPGPEEQARLRDQLQRGRIRAQTTDRLNLREKKPPPDER